MITVDTYGVARLETSLVIYSQSNYQQISNKKAAALPATMISTGCWKAGQIGTYNIDTSIPRNGNDRVEGSEVDA